MNYAPEQVAALEKMRERYVATLVQIMGATRADAHEAFDLALHAVQEAQLTLANVVNRASDDARHQALLLSFIFMEIAMKEGIRAVRAGEL